MEKKTIKQLVIDANASALFDNEVSWRHLDMSAIDINIFGAGFDRWILANGRYDHGARKRYMATLNL